MAMDRLFGAPSALVIAAMVVWLSVRGAELLFPIFIRPPHWFIPACNLFTIFGPIVVGVKMRHAKRDEDVPLTPLVRRLSSGLREL